MIFKPSTRNLEMEKLEYEKLMEALSIVTDFIDFYESVGIGYPIRTMYNDIYDLWTYVNNMEYIEIVDD